MKVGRGRGGIAPQHWVEVSVWPHASAALALYPLNVGGWAQNIVCTFLRRDKSLAPASKQILDPAVVSLVTIMTTLHYPGSLFESIYKVAVSF
jgi:hypothetical protein